MPRGRIQAVTQTLTRGTKQMSDPNVCNIDRDKDANELITKTEPMDEEPKASTPDLSQFKFQKKPHIKIEFEKDSPPKPEGRGLWEPPNWQEFLVNLKNMRANNDAPVDSMGCHMAMDENAPPEVMRYQSLIALMLSSQTKDQVTFAAMERLRARGLTVDNVLSMSDEELGKLIYPVGFWKTKVKYIRKTTQTLKEQYNSDIPDSVEKLCKLTGVGPKMAHICMKVAWNKITGIGVDTHVHRISNRIGWVKKPTSTPEDTRKALQTWLPFDLWSEVNHLMVGFGQTICLPISPICNECLNRDICPSSGKGRKSTKKTPTKQDIKEEDLFEEKKDIPILKLDPIKPKKEVTPKKGVLDTVKDKSPVKSTAKSKTSPKKEKKTSKDGSDSNTKEKFNEYKITLEVGPKNKSTLNVEDKSNKKRKSPRNKTDKLDIEPISVESDVPNKRTRSGKKL